MNQFKACGLRRDDQVEAISLLLEGDAYLWYADNSDAIFNFETFTKLFLQQFKTTISSSTSSIGGTGTLVTTVPDHSSILHLQRTVADEIIKKPTYFRGSQDDVHNWLDKLEQRFTMANWNDEQKLRYISIHLQDDAYRWWMQTSTSIKTWSAFITAITHAFGSTKVQEFAFEQLKWYKQTINQSITQYYDKIIELCKKVDPIMPDSLKLKYLMVGIKDSLKTYVALQDPKTTEAFLLSARKIEDVLSFTKTNNELPDNDITIINATGYKNQLHDQAAPIRTSNNKFNQNNPRYANASQSRTTINQNAPTGNNAHRQNKRFNYTTSTHRSRFPFSIGEASVDGVASKNLHINPSTLNTSLLYLNVSVNNKCMKAMIDTGANRTFISIKALDPSYGKMFVNKLHKCAILADGYSSISVYGTLHLSIIMGDTSTSIKAFVVKEL
ncbi:unnamed protein product, partial [Rotaria sp. Silwood2]